MIMPVITALFMNLAVVSSAFLIAYKAFSFSSFTDSLLCLGLLYYAQVILTELILGIFGLLYMNNLILLNLAVLLTAWLFTHKRAVHSCGLNIREVFTQIFSDKAALLVLSVLVGFGLVKLCINLVNPPFGWDDLNYHFTFAVEWLKHGNLKTPITVFDDPSPSYYPLNASLIYLWLMLPLKNVFLADLGQYPFFILAFLAVYSLSRKAGLERQASFVAAGIFLLIPNLFKQLKIAYADVMVAALFLSSVNFILLLSRDFSWRSTLCFALSAGLLLGTKTVSLPYTFLLLILLLHYTAKRKLKLNLALTALIVIACLGAFSYVRNFIQTNNPLYPLDFKVMGAHLFKGVIDNAVYKAHFKPEDYSLVKLLFHEGLGLQTLVFVLPAVFLSLPIALVKKRGELNFAFFYFLGLPVLLYLTYRFLIPLQNTRYLYPLLGAGMAAAFYTCKLLNLPWRAVSLLAILCVLSSVPELARKQELIVSLALAIAFFFILPHLIKNLSLRNFKINIMFCIAFALLLAILNNNYAKNEFQRYIKMQKYSGFWPDATVAWEWLNSNTKADNIAYSGRPVPFPLYGSAFKNNVYYVSVNSKDPVNLHDFSRSLYSWGYDFNSLHKDLEAEGNYREHADFDTWRANLLRRNTGCLFIYSLHQIKEVEFPVEDSWAKNNPDKFLSVFSNNTVHIYRVIR